MRKIINIFFAIVLIIFSIEAVRDSYIAYHFLKILDKEKIIFIDLNVRDYSLQNLNVNYHWIKYKFLIINAIEYPNNFKIRDDFLTDLIEGEKRYWYFFDLLAHKGKLTIGVVKSEFLTTKFVSIYSIKTSDKVFFELSDYKRKVINRAIISIAWTIILIFIYYIAKNVLY